jgi:hypothetical protein
MGEDALEITGVSSHVEIGLDMLARSACEPDAK